MTKTANKTTDDSIKTLSTGVRVRVLPINPATLAEIQMNIKEPSVPMSHDLDTGFSKPLPDHPDYVAACDQVDLERADAMMSTLVLFNVELVDGMPEDDDWLKKLKILQKTGRLDLSGFDLDDDVDREYLYKKHVALANPDWTELFKLTGVPNEIVARMNPT